MNDFPLQNHNDLTRELGFYTDLQSIRSEDAVTWSLFGYLSYQVQSIRDSFYAELLKSLNLGSDKNCNINLWTRLAHPDNFGTGGPEIDAILLGDNYLLLIECKWTSGIGKKQGVAKDKDQIQIRNLWKQKVGKKLYPNHQIEVVCVANKMLTTETEHFIRWDSFCDFNNLPHKEQFSSYLNWRKTYIK